MWTWGKRRTTYRELYELSGKAAAKLRGMGGAQEKAVLVGHGQTEYVAAQNRPEKTAEAYTKNSYGGGEGYRRMYRTGDIVRFLPGMDSGTGKEKTYALRELIL